MQKKNFNREWYVSKLDGKILGALFSGYPEGRQVTLPHDAMIEEIVDAECANGGQTAYYPGGYYRYVKEFDVPMEWAEKTVSLELEGVYRNGRVYLNNDYVGGCHYGYSNCYVNLNRSIRYGTRNRIEVLVDNEGLSSRWYSGGGLYRNVWLHIGETVHFTIDGVKISTPDVEEDGAVVLVRPTVRNDDRENHQIQVVTEIFDGKGVKAAEEESIGVIYGNSEEELYQRLTISNPGLWSCENPVLYTCRLLLIKDGQETERQEIKFGIRKLQLDAVHGLRINGKQVKLRGACIHHDNGIIGACTLEMAEERRCRLLKEAGFNCIRSAHHPISKAMLDACDRYGMLVMEEFADMWTWPKNMNDYSLHFCEDWEKDVQLMVEKDYNHPSVIMYSTGNEIQEVGMSKGVQINREIAQKIRSLDNSRYVTNAFNALLASLDYEQEICREIREKAAEDKKGLNDIMGDARDITSEWMIKGLEVHPLMTEKIDAFVGSLDIAGYNYLTIRHEMDHIRKPNRVVLGTETFPSEIAKLWDIVERNDYVIGDMTWTGYDYLGEVELGVIRFPGIKTEEKKYGRTAWSGDLDITGKRRPVSYFREIVYGLRKEPYVSVEDPAHYGMKVEKSSWAFEDSLPSWTWRGFEGKPVIVDVYSPSDEVELFLNGKSLGKRPAGKQNGFTAKYELAYEPGTLTAVACEGEKQWRMELQTAQEELMLHVDVDRDEINANGADLAYLTVELRDRNGIVDMQARKDIAIEMRGVGILQGYGNADPYFQGDYHQDTVQSFEGRAQAVIRAGFDAGEIRVKFRAEGCQEVETRIICVRHEENSSLL